MESEVVYDIFNLVYWDWKIVLDLFLGGLGVGAFLYAVGVMFYKNDDRLLTVKVGSILGPVAMSLGLLFMLSEMGQPLRIYKTLIRFNATSTLSWGGLFQEGFIALAAAFAFLLFTNQSKILRQRLAVFAGFFALFVAFYHGFLLSFVTARPLWNAGAVNLVLVISSINTGIAAVLLLTSLSEKGRQEIKELTPLLKNFLFSSLLVQLFASLIWVVALMTGNAYFVDAYHILNKAFGIYFWFGAMGLGVVVPFIILSVYSIGTRRSKLIPLSLISLLILVGGFIFRYVLILAGQMS